MSPQRIAGVARRRLARQAADRRRLRCRVGPASAGSGAAPGGSSSWALTMSRCGGGVLRVARGERERRERSGPGAPGRAIGSSTLDRRSGSTTNGCSVDLVRERRPAASCTTDLVAGRELVEVAERRAVGGAVAGDRAVALVARAAAWPGSGPGPCGGRRRRRPRPRPGRRRSSGSRCGRPRRPRAGAVSGAEGGRSRRSGRRRRCVGPSGESWSWSSGAALSCCSNWLRSSFWARAS